MQGGQTLLTIGALMLFSFAILNINRSLGENDIDLAQNRYRLEALSLITSRIEEASQYYFDEASTDTTSEKRLNDFTDPANLGFDPDDGGEIDDFDDFNGYTEVDTGRSGVIYQISYQVDYVDLNGGQIVHSSTKKYHKRMQIFISDNYSDPLLYRYRNGVKVRDTLEVSFVYSYWFYN